MLKEKRISEFTKKVEEAKIGVSAHEEIALIQIEYLGLEDEEYDHLLDLNVDELKELAIDLQDYDLFSETDRIISEAVLELI